MSSASNVEILNYFNPDRQFKDSESGTVKKTYKNYCLSWKDLNSWQT